MAQTPRPRRERVEEAFAGQKSFAIEIVCEVIQEQCLGRAWFPRSFVVARPGRVGSVKCDRFCRGNGDG